MNIDVSTHQLAELAYKALGGKVSLEDVLTIWHSIGNVVKNQLTLKRGVKLSSFGTFTLTDKGEPIFIVSSDLTSQFKLKQRALATSGNVPISSLNFTQVKEGTQLSRETVDKIYSKFLTCMGRCIFEARNILVTIHRVAEISISNGEILCTFIPQFLALFQDGELTYKGKQRDILRETAKNTSTMLTGLINMKGLTNDYDDNNDNYRSDIKARTTGLNSVNRRGLSSNDNDRGFANNNTIAGRPSAAATLVTRSAGVAQFGADEPAERRGKARPISASRGGGSSVNPITGDRNNNTAAIRPVSAGRAGMSGQRVARNNDNYSDNRRPGSAQSFNSVSTSSLLHSPRSIHSNNNNGRIGGGGLRKEQLDRFNNNMKGDGGGRTTPRPAATRPGIDARRIAAKALDAGDIVAKVRSLIVQRGGSNGIRSITKLLSIMDDNRDNKLSKEELRYGLRDYGIDLSPTELEQVFFYFDRDGNGFIDATEFLVGLRGELNERRRKIVRMAFQILDTDRSGVVTVDEVMQRYDFTWHPAVREGKKTVKEAAKEFMSQWEKANSTDGNITPEEFEDHYKEISASIDDDDYFELMMRNAWRISGGEGAAANTANRRVLVTNKDGSQSVQTIQNELSMKGGDIEDVRRRLSQQGVTGGDISMNGLVDNRDKNARNPGGRPSGATNNYNKNGRPAAAPTGGKLSQQQRPSAPVRKAWLDEGPSGGDRNSFDDGDDDGDNNYDIVGSNSNRQQQQQQRKTRPATPLRGSQQLQQQQRAGNIISNNNSLSSAGNRSFDVYDTLQRLLYSPPIALEAFCAKLQVSSASSVPRVAMGAFQKRLSVLDPTLTRDQLKQLWQAVDPGNAGAVEVNTIHELMAGKYGKDKTSSKSAGVIERVIKKILERCGEKTGIKGLQRTLAIMDNDGNKTLTKEELKYGLKDYGIDLNIRELDEIFNYFDRDHSGTLDFNEFLIGIKGDLNERRRKMVKLAFNILDTDRSGFITVEEILAVYDFSHHPEVANGKKTIKQAMHDFMGQWDDVDGDGSISYAEFEDHYKGISASIDGDDYFELMMRNAWRISGGEGAAANTANRRVLVTNKDGSQSVQTIQNELGMQGGDIEDVRRRLSQQGVTGGVISMNGLVDNRDKNARKQMPDNYRGAGNAINNRNAVPARPSSGSNNNIGRGRGQESFSSTNAATRDELTRHAAAAKLAAAYRGRKGRQIAAHEIRKQEAVRQQQNAEQIEASRPKPKDIYRPKGNSYIGF